MTVGWRLRFIIVAAVALATGLAAPQADAASTPDLSEYAAFGIDRETGELVVYWFDQNSDATREYVGQLQQDDGALMGIQGATHVPGHTGIFYAFWTDDQGQTNLVHISPAEAASGGLVAAMRPIEGGLVTGAASFSEIDGTARTFILQRESFVPTYNIDGRININPNNAAHMRFEFERTTEGGEILVSIDRADLLAKDSGEEDSQGNYVVFDDDAGEGGVHDYEAHTTMIQVRPKALDAQGELEIVDQYGKRFEINNSNTYNLTGKLRVRIYNDHVDHNGKAMGKWWLEIEGEAQLEQSEVGTLTRIAELRASGDDAEVVEAAVLSESLLADIGIDPEHLIGLGGRVNDGQIEMFVADGNNVYRVQVVEDGAVFDADNPIVDSEPLTLPTSRDVISLDFAGDFLLGVDSYANGQFMVPDVDGSEVVLHTTNKPGSETLGAITTLPADVAEAMLRPSYD